MAELRSALRRLRQNPIFSITAVLTLALGMGGATAMFTIVRAVVLKPLPYPDSQQLVNISGGASPTRYQELKASTHSLSGVGAFVGAGLENLTLTGYAEPEVLHAARVSANFLTILQKKPIAGRSFYASEDAPDGAPVVLINESLWKGRFHGDPRIVGKVVTLSETPYTIIGVLPSGFQFPLPKADVWLTRPAEWPQMPVASRRLSPFLNLFGRLNSGVTLDQANAELALLHRRYAQQHPAMLDAKLKSPTELRLMQDDLIGHIRDILWMLFGAVGFVLLITCANVASLMLARANARSKELAVRSAIGASRLRLMADSLVESLLLSMIGGVMGVLLAIAVVRALPLLASFDLPRVGEIQLDAGVLCFAVVLCIGAALLFGLAPSLNAGRPDLISLLRGTGSASGDKRTGGARSMLVIAQIAFSTILLIGAALMMESLIHLHAVPVGFHPENLITAEINLPSRRYDTSEKQSVFYKELLERINHLPGLRGATVAMTLPMGNFAGVVVQDAATPPLPLNQRPIATIGIVAPGYFQTLQVPFRRGRDFGEQDRTGSERVAIIDEALARRFWPQYPHGLNPVGQHLLVGGVNPNPARIVGIVASVHQSLENNVWPETVYVAFRQVPQPNSMLAVRTEGNPDRFARIVREAVESIDHDLPLSNLHSMDYLMDEALGQRQLVVALLGFFATLSLSLALLGIYGLISYSIGQRRQELAIRSALGAQREDILQLVLRQAVVLAAAGIVLGLFAAFWLTQALKNLLFGISATDPVTFFIVASLFAVCALTASYIPGRRAAKLDPLAALRL